MSWTTVRQEVRLMRFEELYERRHRRELTMADAAEQSAPAAPSLRAPAVCSPTALAADRQSGICARRWMDGLISPG